MREDDVERYFAARRAEGRGGYVPLGPIGSPPPGEPLLAAHLEPTWREHIEQALRLLAEGMPTEYRRREVLRVLDGAERARAAGRVG